MADVLVVDGAPVRLRRLGAVGAVLLVALVGGGAALRSTLPPPPLEVRVAGVTGSALQDESFVRLHVSLEHAGARELDEAVLTVAGTTARGQHPTAFSGEDRTWVQVDLTPSCASLEDLAPGVLDLRLHDATGEARQVRLDIPTDVRLERLLRYRCT